MKIGIRHLATVLLSVSFVVTAIGVQAAELKIGFVNAAQVLEEAPQADELAADPSIRRRFRRDRRPAVGLSLGQSLEKEFAPRDKALVASQKAVRELEEKLTRDGAIMSETERRKLERDVISQKRDLKRSQEEFREDLNIRRNEAFDKLRRRVFEVITDISKKENYDLVVSDGVVYANDRIDITGKIIDRLKQEFKQSSKK